MRERKFISIKYTRPYRYAKFGTFLRHPVYHQAKATRICLQHVMLAWLYLHTRFFAFFVLAS